MMFFNDTIYRFGTVFAQLAPLAGMLDPMCGLYGMLAGTYATAASAATHDNHRLLARCYVTSAILHGLIAACYQMHM